MDNSRAADLRVPAPIRGDESTAELLAAASGALLEFLDALPGFGNAAKVRGLVEACQQRAAESRVPPEERPPSDPELRTTLILEIHRLRTECGDPARDADEDWVDALLVDLQPWLWAARGDRPAGDPPVELSYDEADHDAVLAAVGEWNDNFVTTAELIGQLRKILQRPPSGVTNGGPSGPALEAAILASADPLDTRRTIPRRWAIAMLRAAYAVDGVRAALPGGDAPHE